MVCRDSDTTPHSDAYQTNSQRSQILQSVPPRQDENRRELALAHVVPETRSRPKASTTLLGRVSGVNQLSGCLWATYRVHNAWLAGEGERSHHPHHQQTDPDDEHPGGVTPPESHEHER